MWFNWEIYEKKNLKKYNRILLETDYLDEDEDTFNIETYIINDTLEFVITDQTSIISIETTTVVDETTLEADQTTTISGEIKTVEGENSTESDKISPIAATNSPSTSSNKGLIMGILIVGIAVLIGIIISVILCQQKCTNNNEKSKEENNIMKTQSELDLMKYNKEKADNLIKQLNSNVKEFNKKYIKNCSKWIICSEAFIDKSSIVITTNCGHTFHKTCIINSIYTNYNCPKCPTCKKNFLRQESNIPPFSKIEFVEE